MKEKGEEPTEGEGRKEKGEEPTEGEGRKEKGEEPTEGEGRKEKGEEPTEGEGRKEKGEGRVIKGRKKYKINTQLKIGKPPCNAWSNSYCYQSH